MPSGHQAQIIVITACKIAALGTMRSFSPWAGAVDMRIGKYSACCRLHTLSADTLMNTRGRDVCERDLTHDITVCRLPDDDIFKHCGRKWCGGECAVLFFHGLELRCAGAEREQGHLRSQRSGHIQGGVTPFKSVCVLECVMVSHRSSHLPFVHEQNNSFSLQSLSVLSCQ